MSDGWSVALGLLSAVVLVVVGIRFGMDMGEETSLKECVEHYKLEEPK